MVRVFTSRVTYEGEDKLNTTVQSGEGLGCLLAPTWALVGGHKHFEALENQDSAAIAKWARYTPLSEADYTDGYLKLLRTRYAADKEPFLDLLNRERVTLTCYCGAGDFCHRHIAVKVLEKIAQHHTIPFERGGEIDARTGHVLSTKRDPDWQTLSFGVAPITAPNGRTALGFAALAVVAQGEAMAALEVAHFGNRGRARAEEYTEHLAKSLKQRGYALQGGTNAIEGTVGSLTRLAQHNHLPGEWNALTDEERVAWEQGEFSLTHSFNQVRPLTGAGLDHDAAFDR